MATTYPRWNSCYTGGNSSPKCGQLLLPTGKSPHSWGGYNGESWAPEETLFLTKKKSFWLNKWIIIEGRFGWFGHVKKLKRIISGWSDGVGSSLGETQAMAKEIVKEQYSARLDRDEPTGNCHIGPRPLESSHQIVKPSSMEKKTLNGES